MKLQLLSIISLLSATTFAQNVGIGTTSPQYKLDVNGTGYFQNIDGSATTAGLKGYSNIYSRFAPGVVGTGVSIGTLGNANTQVGIGILGYNNLNNSNINYLSGTGVQGFSSAGHGIAGITTRQGYSGVFGLTTFSDCWAGSFVGANGGNAGALYTVGPVRLAALNEGAGKVLTCDADGYATWQTPGTQPAENVSFSAYLANVLAATAGTTYQLENLTTEFQESNSLDNFSGVFIAPSDGVYQFTARIGFWPSGSEPICSNVSFKRNGAVMTGAQFTRTTISAGCNWDEALNYTKTVKLVAGDQVSVSFVLFQNGATTINISGGANTNSSFFSGVKLH